MKLETAAMGASWEEFSVVVLASDLAVDASHRHSAIKEENWHDWSHYHSPDEDFSDLDLLQFFLLQGSDKNGNRVLRVVGKYNPGMENNTMGTYESQLSFVMSYSF